jgi:hypothetical protein
MPTMSPAGPTPGFSAPRPPLEGEQPHVPTSPEAPPSGAFPGGRAPEAQFPSQPPAAGLGPPTDATYMPPGFPSAAPEPARRRAAYVVAGVAGVIALAVGLVVVLLSSHHSGSASSGRMDSVTTTPPAPPPPDPEALARQTASRLDAVLLSSAGARSGVQPSVNAITTCNASEADLAVLAHAAQERQAILTQLQSLNVTALPDGPSLLADLQAAEQASLEADQSFLDWGRSQLGCSGRAVLNVQYQAGMTASQRATAAKTSFTQGWNGIAGRYNLAPRGPEQI